LGFCCASRAHALASKLCWQHRSCLLLRFVTAVPGENSANVHEYCARGNDVWRTSAGVRRRRASEQGVVGEQVEYVRCVELKGNMNARPVLLLVGVLVFYYIYVIPTLHEKKFWLFVETWAA
jgi:hypothetical protein